MPPYLVRNYLTKYTLFFCNVHAILEISSRSNKPLKVPSDSISEGLIFQNFLGGMPPDPPRFGMLCMPDHVLRTQYVHYNVFVPPLL